MFLPTTIVHPVIPWHYIMDQKRTTGLRFAQGGRTPVICPEAPENPGRYWTAQALRRTSVGAGHHFAPMRPRLVADAFLLLHLGVLPLALFEDMLAVCWRWMLLVHQPVTDDPAPLCAIRPAIPSGRADFFMPVQEGRA